MQETQKMYTTNTLLTTALGYAQNQKQYFHTFLTDGRIPISNNDCENKQRPYVLGRKAWLFADTQEGARANAVLYSIVETAKANQLVLFEYFQYLLNHLPFFPPNPSDDMLEKFLPWSDQLPDVCRSKKPITE